MNFFPTDEFRLKGKIFIVFKFLSVGQRESFLKPGIPLIFSSTLRLPGKLFYGFRHLLG